MRVALPSCPPDVRRGALIREVHTWATATPMRALVDAFGGTLPPADPPDPPDPADPTATAALLAWLDAFSAAHWDFRAGRERDEMPPSRFSSEVARLVVESAAALHLADAAAPPRRSYEHLLVLGGRGRACLQRTEHAARLVSTGVVVAGDVTALGSFRPLTGPERELPALAGLPEPAHEIDAMDAGVRAAFGFTGLPGVERDPGGAWEVRTYPGVRVLAAPSGEPERRRANTADTYEFWARHARPRPGDRILAVTSPMYVPFQHCDAIRMLGLRYRCGIDTIGLDPARATLPQPPDADGPDRYLQEIRSAILSMRGLLHAVG